MKKLMILAVLALVMLVGCSQNDTPVDNSQGDLMMAIQSNVVTDNIIPSFDANTYSVYSSETEDITIYPELGPTDGRDDRGPKERPNDRGMKERKGDGFKIREILFRLKITRDQMPAIHELMKAHHDCVFNVMLPGMEERAVIIKAFREERATTIKTMKEAGATREEIAAALQALNTRLKAALDELIPKAALCDCLKDLLQGIYGTLTAEQQALFLQWLSTLTNDCLTGWTPATR